MWNNTNERDIERIDVYVRKYLCWLASVTSGEYLLKVWKILRKFLGNELGEETSLTIEHEVQILRRRANIKNPVKARAADAILLQELDSIMRQSQYVKLNYKEKMSLEILCIAFITMSRVAEIVSLTVDDVSMSGDKISTRPKTYAKTCRRVIKRVTDVGNIKARTFLQLRRQAAIRHHTPLLFAKKEGEKATLSSSTVSKKLKEVMMKLNLDRRVTAHSGRKGAAVQALLQGVPVVAIQSFGAWKDLRTLEVYVGEALRRSIALGDLLAPINNLEKL